MNNKIVICLGILMIASSVFASIYQIYEPKTLFFSNWGREPHEFGLRKGMEIETVGPQTFSLDRKGNLFILDSIKGQIKKFGQGGDFHGNIGFNISGSAIAVGDEGQIFVLESQTVYEYTASGELIKRHSISKGFPLIEGYGQGIKIDDFGNISINKLQKSYQIGSLLGGKLKAMGEENQLGSEKKGLANVTRDKWFETKWKNKHKSVVQILNDKGNILREISIDTSDVFGSVLFLGQDKNGLIYIETERITPDNYVHLEVRKYNEKETLICVIEFPNDYYTTVYKKLEVDDNGNIYQLLTLPEGVKLIKWEQQ